MFEHIGNCHGEWTMLLASVPFIGVWVKMILAKRAERRLNSNCPCGHSDGETH